MCGYGGEIPERTPLENNKGSNCFLREACTTLCENADLKKMSGPLIMEFSGSPHVSMKPKGLLRDIKIVVQAENLNFSPYSYILYY